MPQNPMANLTTKIPKMRRLPTSEDSTSKDSKDHSSSKNSSSKPSKPSSSSSKPSSGSKAPNQSHSIRLGRIGRPGHPNSNSNSRSPSKPSPNRSSSHSSGRTSSHSHSSGHSSHSSSHHSSKDIEGDEQGKTSLIIQNTLCSSINVFFGGCLLYLVSNNYLTKLEEVFAISLLFLSIIDFLLLLLRILRAKRLWRVGIKTYSIKEWIPITLSGSLIHTKHYPITSLLELANLRGSSISRTMLVNGYLFYGICLIFTAVKTVEINDDDDKEIFLMRMDTILIFSCGMALCNVGAWQLNPWSLLHRWMHRMASLSSIVSVIAFTLQQVRQINKKENDSFSGLISPQVIGLCCSICCTFTLWVFFLIRARYYAKKLLNSKEEEKELANNKKKKSNDNDNDIELNEDERKNIHRHSIRCLISQSLMVLVGKIGVVMWVWYAKNN